MSTPREKLVYTRPQTPQEKAAATRRAKKNAKLFIMRVINRHTDVYVFPFIEKIDKRGEFSVTRELGRACIFSEREHALFAANELNRQHGELYIFEPMSLADAEHDGCLGPDLARRYHILRDMVEHTPLERDFLQLLHTMKGGAL